MVLHIVDDSNTINHFIRRVNELASDDHRFLVVTPFGKLSQIAPAPGISTFTPTTESIHDLVQTLDGYKAVFIHNLCYVKSRIVLESPEKVIIIWGVWGYDYYNVYPELYRNLFLPFTRLANASLGKFSLSTKFIKYKMHPFTKHFGWKSKDRIRQKAAARINFTFNSMPRHSDIFRVLPIDVSRRFQLSYYSIEYITEGLEGLAFDLGENIYIGNSSSNSSNHIDLFLQLKNQPENRDIIVPLGYGCPRYRRLINLAGKVVLKNKFIPINSRIPLNEYNNLLLGCNVMIFNHKRAQGLGNVLFGVWAGHKIFLRETNPVYSYLKSMGIKVFSIEGGWSSGSLDPLGEEWQDHNRNIIEARYSEFQVRKDLKLLLSRIRGEDCNI